MLCLLSSANRANSVGNFGRISLILDAGMHFAALVMLVRGVRSTWCASIGNATFTKLASIRFMKPSRFTFEKLVYHFSEASTLVMGF